MKKMFAFVLAALLLAGVLAVLAENNAKEEPAAPAATAEPAQAAEEADAEQPEESAADAQEEQQVYMLGGEVTEVGEGFFLMQDAEMGEVQVNIGDDSMFEGVTQEELAAGQYVYVLYDGKMTRSLPPQVFALQVNLYAVTGEVTGLEEGSVMLRRDEIGDDVIIRLPEDAPELAVGDRVTAYTNGIMTMSLPAQMSAMKVVKE